ncbi:MAG: alpha/beta hydrolase [Myxococcales bacterium]|nr:alpha/beta hydrolase [Polyangiaceae bacterium]MDW8247803.1 alpha/beta hydrolase [Myxococcales bacterium]
MGERSWSWARAGLWLLGAYGTLVGTAYAAQRLLLYPAPRPPREPSQHHGKVIQATALSGCPVFALWNRVDLAAPTVVHFHGNGEQLADVEPLVAWLGQKGRNVLAVEYPGYGLASEQQPSETALYEAAEAALVYLRDTLGVPPERTTLVGQSLGSGVAAEMALRGHGARLILLSPYTSIPDVAVRVVPFLPGRWMVMDRFATAEKAPKISCPVLIIHGEQDKLIPASMGRTLGTLFPHATVQILAGVHHNDLFAPPHGQELLEKIAEFSR